MFLLVKQYLYYSILDNLTGEAIGIGRYRSIGLQSAQNPAMVYTAIEHPYMSETRSMTSKTAARTLFFGISLLMLLSILISTSPLGGTGTDWTYSLLLASGGALTTFLLMVAVESYLGKFTPKTVLTLVVGLLVGSAIAGVMGQLVLQIMSVIPMAPTSLGLPVTMVAVYLVSIYVGLSQCLRASEKWSASIPFISLEEKVEIVPQEIEVKRALLADSTFLKDPRAIDLASSGLLDGDILVPRFVLTELQMDSESEDDLARTRGRRGLEVLRKLQEIPPIQINVEDTDFPELSNSWKKITKLAVLRKAAVLSASTDQLHQPADGSIRIINIHNLAASLKPLMQAGKFIEIKIQRQGKEARQGVGYLEDGTMVVINGGGDSIGHTIKAQVLSVKHSSAGRIVFCNAMDENNSGEHHERSHRELTATV